MVVGISDAYCALLKSKRAQKVVCLAAGKIRYRPKPVSFISELHTPLINGVL
jgi:hypothetical protein